MSRTQPDLLRNESDFPVTFGRYTLQGVLGEGGMARVFRAELQGSEGFRKPAAVKIVRAAVAADNDNLRRALINEARVGGLLHHPNVVETYDYGEVDGHPYIAMELVRGVVLDEVLECVPELEPSRCLDISMQICAGLDHAHNLEAVGQETHLVHRDLKPSNIIISRDGLVKVMDFGIAKASALSTTLTQTGTTKGTPAYMSPEQVGGQKLDRRSDLFSLGAIIVELALGKRLFRGDTLISVLSSVIQVEERLADSDILGQLDAYCAGLGPVVKRCLRVAPGERYTDAAALETDLQTLCTGLPMASPMKLWIGELMKETESRRATKQRASWSSLDDEPPSYLEPTLQTDKPAHLEPAAAAKAAASVRATRAQYAQDGEAAGSLREAPLPPAGVQPGYPGPDKTMPLDQPVQQHKPPGTLWNERGSRKGLSAGLLIGLICGVVVAFAAVGITFLGGKLLNGETEGDPITTTDPVESGSPVAPDDPAEIERTVEVEPTSGVEAQTVPRQETPATPPAASEPTAEVEPPAAVEASAAAEEPAVVEPQGDEGQQLQLEKEIPSAGNVKRQNWTSLVSKRSRRTRGAGTARTSESLDDPESYMRDEDDVASRTRKRRTRRSSHRRETASKSVGSLLQQDSFRWAWVWEPDSENGSKRGYFMVQGKDVAELDVSVEFKLSDGPRKKVTLKPSGSRGKTRIWRSEITFPTVARGTVEWSVRVRGKRSDGEPINQQFEGKKFLL